jgi:DNA modification methylase
VNYEIKQGDCLDVLKTLPSESVNCCITSPPYWGLRDYGHDGQIGLESTPEAYVARMVEVFREVRRVLRDDGTCWLNLGDSYFATTKSDRNGLSSKTNFTCTATKDGYQRPVKKVSAGSLAIKPKDLVGIPWRVAFALQADGWWLRQDIIWHKPNPMPESVTDRCTKAHEYMFLLAKSERYYYDAEAITEAQAGPLGPPRRDTGGTDGYVDFGMVSGRAGNRADGKRNRRSVWTVATKPYSGAHFATFPKQLIEPCVLAGCPKDGIILDPFGGSGTTAEVAIENGRNALLIELNPEYIELAKTRISNTQTNLFC